MLSLDWARIVNSGPYGPLWRPQPYYNFTVELILYGIIFWVIAHWYVERRDRARWRAKLTGEEATSSDHDILTEKRLFQILRVAIVVSIIFTFTVPFIEADLTESQTYRNRNRMYEELYSKQDGIAISPGDYFSHDMSLDNGTRISFEYTCSNLLDAYILSDQEYENYLKSSRSSQYIFKKNDTQINTGILSEIYKIPQSTILSWIESNWAPELESLIIGMGRIERIGFTVPEDGRYWFVISNVYNSTTAYPSEFTVTEYWDEYETVTKRVKVGEKMITFLEYIIELTRSLISPEIPEMNINYFEADPNVITLGDYSTLSWDTSNADSVTINPAVGSVDKTKGVVQVTPTETTTYTLSAVYENKSLTEECTVEVVKDFPIYNIQLKPPSPATLNLSQKLFISFNYYLNESRVRIFFRPYSQGSLSPKYAAHPSGVYSRTHGRGVAHFTITSGDVQVDQIRIRIIDADRILLHEEFIPVNYSFKYVLDDVSRARATEYSPIAITNTEYNWVSPVMDARIINEKYALLGTAINREGNESPIIEFFDKHGNKLGNLTSAGEEMFRADCFTETRDDGIIIAGIVECRPDDDSVIVKYSADGEHLWNHTYSTYPDREYYALKILETGDDAYMCIAIRFPGSGVLIKFTPENFTLHDLPTSYYDFIATRDDGYLLVGEEMHITKLYANGSIEWTKVHSQPLRVWGSSVLELPDGYIIAGGTRNTDNEASDFWVLRTDTEGIPLWNKTYGGAKWETAMDIAMIPDGFILTGQTGSNVWVLWITEYGELYRSEIHNKSGQSSDVGHFIIQGFNQNAVIASTSLSWNEPWIIILD